MGLTQETNMTKQLSHSVDMSLTLRRKGAEKMMTKSMTATVQSDSGWAIQGQRHWVGKDGKGTLRYSTYQFTNCYMEVKHLDTVKVGHYGRRQS